MQTFGETARYDDGPWDDHRVNRDEVRSYYEQLMHAVPDLRIDVQHRHVTEEGIILEVVIRGTHLGPWRGLPATGRHVDVPLCALYTFDENGRLASESIYYDRATVLRQLGVFHETTTLVGMILTVLTHPVTILRALASGGRLRAQGRKEL
jgi:steroid delta-isomerase-like uncharacterized protein